MVRVVGSSLSVVDAVRMSRRRLVRALDISIIVGVVDTDGRLASRAPGEVGERVCVATRVGVSMHPSSSGAATTEWAHPWSECVGLRSRSLARRGGRRHRIDGSVRMSIRVHRSRRRRFRVLRVVVGRSIERPCRVGRLAGVGGRERGIAAFRLGRCTVSILALVLVLVQLLPSLLPSRRLGHPGPWPSSRSLGRVRSLLPLVTSPHGLHERTPRAPPHLSLLRRLARLVRRNDGDVSRREGGRSRVRRCASSVGAVRRLPRAPR